MCSRVVTNHCLMRSFIFQAVCIAAFLSSPWTACSQNYYVVVGAFAAKENASEFKGYLPVQLTDTSYSVFGKENLQHFYVLKTSDRESAIARTMDLKKVIGEWQSEERVSLPTSAEERITGNIVLATQSAEMSDFPVGANSSASASASASLAGAADIAPRPAGKYFKFRIESPEGRPLNAKLHHVDFANGRELATYETNTYVNLLRPGHSATPMAVVCGMFGYKEIQKFIDYSNPYAFDNDAYVDSDGAWVIPYRLERVEAGDVSTMYNVSFYHDAAIMRKSSQKDLDELVTMMRHNPYYEITIHSHCNGRNKRDILAPGASRNYFDVAGSVQVSGSAKDLTELRAEAIRSYLMDHGIDPTRIDIFSWGASDMLVRPDDPNAAINDRIEIEFTRD